MKREEFSAKLTVSIIKSNVTRPLCSWWVLFTKGKDLAVKVREKTTSPSFHNPRSSAAVTLLSPARRAKINVWNCRGELNEWDIIAAMYVPLAAADRGEPVCWYHVSFTVSAPEETYPRGVRDALRQLVSPINFVPVRQVNRNNRRVLLKKITLFLLRHLVFEVWTVDVILTRIPKRCHDEVEGLTWLYWAKLYCAWTISTSFILFNTLCMDVYSLLRSCY